MFSPLVSLKVLGSVGRVISKHSSFFRASDRACRFIQVYIEEIDESSNAPHLDDVRHWPLYVFCVFLVLESISVLVLLFPTFCSLTKNVIRSKLM